MDITLGYDEFVIFNGLITLQGTIDELPRLEIVGEVSSLITCLNELSTIVFIFFFKFTVHIPAAPLPLK